MSVAVAPGSETELLMEGRPVTAFAALGDSFTAGRDSVEGQRWPDLIAAGLRVASPDLVYANLAVDGAPSAAVAQQVGPALEIDPDFITVICGANDVLLTTRPDIDGYEERFDKILATLREGAPAATIVTATAPEGWKFMPLGRRTRRRVDAAMRDVNAATRRAAARHDVHCMPVEEHPALDDSSIFSPDGLHASAAGHRLIARESARVFAGALGLAIDPEMVAR